MKHALDNALTIAEPLALDEEGQSADFLYSNMRQCFVAALELARTLEASEPQQAIEWVLAHLPEDLNPEVRVSVNGPNLDPRVHPFCSAQGRAQWILETQRERLQAAAGALRTANDRAMVGAVSRSAVINRLMEVDGMTKTNAHNYMKDEVLKEIVPGMYTAASVEALLRKIGPEIKKRKKRKDEEHYLWPKGNK